MSCWLSVLKGSMPGYSYEYCGGTELVQGFEKLAGLVGERGLRQKQARG